VTLQLSPDAVLEEIQLRISDHALGGGYVFAGVRNIHPDIAPENIVAMYKEVRLSGYTRSIQNS
jgi:uroporphyrinogen decarboxylase